MHFDPAPLRGGFDWNYRPDTYFLPGAAPPPEPLPDEIRHAIGSIHPSLMGGLYLPGYLPGEVEIVRVQLQSVTADVMAVRARPCGGGIAYRVVSEYEESLHYPAKPATSSRPLTFAGIARLMENANPDSSEDGGLAFSDVVWNASEGGYDRDPRKLYQFATVTSDFYPKLGAWYDRLIRAWLDAFAAETMLEDETEEDACENDR